MTNQVLPAKWVDEIFGRLSVRYGRAFLSRWDGIDLELVKADWAEELGGFANWPEAIKYAINHMDPERPPTAAMFREIAAKAPRPDRPKLPEPAANPDRAKAEIAKLNARNPEAKQDPKDWARRVLARHEAGEKLSPTTLRFAREALGLGPFSFAH